MFTRLTNWASFIVPLFIFVAYTLIVFHDDGVPITPEAKVMVFMFSFFWLYIWHKDFNQFK